MTSNNGLHEGPPALQLNGPWGSFVGPAPCFMAGAAILHTMEQPPEPYSSPGPPDPEEPEPNRQIVAAQLAELQHNIEALLPQALTLPHAIRQHFLQPLHYARMAAQHYAHAEFTSPMPYFPGLKFIPLSPRPQWHEWSRRLTNHLVFTKGPPYQWHSLTAVADAVQLDVPQALHAAEHNTKFKLRPSAAQQFEIRATHSDSEEDSDTYY